MQVVTPLKITMSDLYTCITCRVAFLDGETQRLHYRSDWHRYNLKRKVAELPPVNAEEFTNRVLAQRSDIESAGNKTKYCESCRKRFNNEKSFDNHLHSKKHKENEMLRVKAQIEEKFEKIEGQAKEKLETVEDQTKTKLEEATKNEESESSCEEVDSDEWEEDFENPVLDNVCLFCTHRSRSLVRNLRHMSQAHSFFIPDVEFCTDVKSLVNYLGEKVYDGFICLWCNGTGRGFHSAEAVQGHMRDKGHCKMLHEGAALAEYTDFYDYSASYPDQSEDNDTEVSVPVLDDTDYQLVLPSGAVIGHRSLMRYYKQHFSPNSALAQPQRALAKVMTHYRALGWTSSKREEIVKKVRDLSYMTRVQTKWATKLGIKANKLQAHFRPQVNF